MFEDDERAYLLEIKAISHDEVGKEVLVGLSREETLEYLALIRTKKPRGDRYLELHDKHERARIDAIASEHVLNTENPTRH